MLHHNPTLPGIREGNGACLLFSVGRCSSMIATRLRSNHNVSETVRAFFDTMSEISAAVSAEDAS
jgi:hypothetical protein